MMHLHAVSICATFVAEISDCQFSQAPSSPTSPASVYAYLCVCVDGISDFQFSQASSPPASALVLPTARNQDNQTMQVGRNVCVCVAEMCVCVCVCACMCVLVLPESLIANQRMCVCVRVFPGCLLVNFCII